MRYWQGKRKISENFLMLREGVFLEVLWLWFDEKKTPYQFKYKFCKLVNYL